MCQLVIYSICQYIFLQYGVFIYDVQVFTKWILLVGRMIATFIHAMRGTGVVAKNAGKITFPFNMTI